MVVSLLFQSSQPAPAEAPQQQQPPPSQSINPAVAHWAFAQAAVQLGPLLSQLTAANIQQVQQQLEADQKKAQLQAQIQEHQAKLLQQQLLQLQQQGTAPAQQAPPPSANNTEQFARDLKQAYDSICLQQQQQQQQGSQLFSNRNGSPNLSVASMPGLSVSNQRSIPSQESQVNTRDNAAAPQPVVAAAASRPRTEQDKDGGSDLLGFLSTLRQSYEDALRNKSPVDNTITGGGIQNMNRLTEVASNAGSSGKSDSSSDDANTRGHPMVTDSASSQQLESSAEDSEEWTSKKTDPSSSSEGGDSDKEVVIDNRKQQRASKEQSKGPPRKRHKSIAKAEQANN